jgi:hypothetical protein
VLRVRDVQVLASPTRGELGGIVWPEVGVALGVDMWSQKQLILPRSQVDNAGLYTCLAESPAGEVEKSFRVRVQGREGVWGQGKGERHGPARVSPSLTSCHPSAPPNVVGPRGPRSVVGLAPGQLILECSVEAEPAPEIEWHRGGVLLQVSPSSPAEASDQMTAGL